MEKIVFVDKNDNPIGTGTIAEAIKQGVAQRVVRVFVLNPKGELLMQKRAAGHSIFPNRWDHSAAGHVDEGEDYDTAAYRELKEEVGIESVELKKVTKIYIEEDLDGGKMKKTFNMLYIGHYDGPITPDPREVSEVRWVALNALRAWMARAPDDFTPGFRDAFKEFLRAEEV